jgi:FAD-linked sulfhydryl oxidase
MAHKKEGSTPGRGLFQNDDCERPACDEMKAVLPASMAEFEEMKKKYEKQKKVECPPGSAEMGLGTWKLLHSMVAWYPDQPTKKQKKGMTSFFQTLADFYPCTYCAEDFQTNLEKSPVEADSRTDLCVWLCNQHNQVNQKLGKPLFECNMKDLDERWRKSSASNCNK